MSPRFSIVTINRNNAVGLFKTLSSVAVQTFRNFEEVVVDGASTDGSPMVPSRVPGCQATIVSEPDAGIYDAMNKGIARSRGEYILFLNSGDWLWDRDVLSRVDAAIADSCAEIIYGDFFRDDARHGARLVRQPQTLSAAAYDPPRTWGLCHQSIFYSRDLIMGIGGYDAGYRIAADWLLTLRAIDMGARTFHIPVPICFYDGSGVSSNPEHERLALEEIGMVLHRCKGDSSLL